MADLPLNNPLSRNSLLATLPSDDLLRMQARCEIVEVSLRQVLLAAGQEMTAVYFPDNAWVSMLTLLEDGTAAEVGLVGAEGMVGLPIFLGDRLNPLEAIIQGPGRLWRMGAEDFLREVEASPALNTILKRYTLAFQQQAFQTVACNGHHTLSQRLARWLLMARDRAKAEEFPMTQEFLAVMLCVHRPAVTLAAQALQKAGLIRYAQGRMSISDPVALEAAACECHAVTQGHFDRLMKRPG